MTSSLKTWPLENENKSHDWDAVIHSFFFSFSLSSIQVNVYLSNLPHPFVYKKLSSYFRKSLESKMLSTPSSTVALFKYKFKIIVKVLSLLNSNTNLKGIYL